MSTQPPLTFGALLRRYRLAAGLTQEELAERARLSLAAINTLERGARLAPRKETVALLAEALALAASERAELEAAARRHGPALPPTPTPALAEEQPTSSEVPLPPEAEPPQVSGPQRRGQFIRVSLPLPAKAHGKLAAGLVSVLMVVALLGSVLFFKVGLGAGALAGQHPRTLCLATDLSTSGADADDGKPVENAVNLAVMQNQNLGSGYMLKVINYNDEAATQDGPDPQHGAQNVTDMVRNSCVVGMVGPYKSKVALAALPIAANAGLVMISPANTNPALTLRTYAEIQGLNFDQLHPPGKPINYFRIAPSDAVQFIADANLTFNLGARSAYLVKEPSSYAELLTSGFTQTFEGKGGRIVGTDSVVQDNPTLIAQVADRIVAAHPDAVFYGGITGGVSGLLKAQLVKLGYTSSFVAGDGIALDPGFVQQVGVNIANGTFASIGVRDLSTFTSGAAATFISDYAARHPGQAPNPYAANAYDATMLLITACKNLIRAGKDVTRAALIEQVQHIQYAGVTGPISFDVNGDITHGVFSIYTVQNGQWVYAWQVSV